MFDALNTPFSEILSNLVLCQLFPNFSKRYTPPLIVPAYNLIGEKNTKDLILPSSLSFSKEFVGIEIQSVPKLVLIHGRIEPNATVSAWDKSSGLYGTPTSGA